MLIRPLLRIFRHANSRKGHIVRTIASDSKRSFWAMADQGVVSLGNFLIFFLLARYFGDHGERGHLAEFGLLVGMIGVLNGLQNALAIYPISVKGAAADDVSLRRMAAMSVAMSMVAWPAMGACLFATALLWGTGAGAGAWAALTLLAWQVQETLRRSLMSHLRFRAAIVGDVISYLGPVLGVVLLAQRDTLSVAGTFQGMALSSAVGAVVQAVQLGGLGSFAVAELRAFARECWTMGRWVLLQSLSTLFTTILYEWNIGYWCGKELLGVYYAMMNILKPANPIAFAVATLILPNAARARREQGMLPAKRVMQRFGLLGALPLAPYLGLMVVAPGLAIAAFHGWDSAYGEHTLLLRITAVATALQYVGVVSGAFLNAVEHGRYNFIAQSACAAAYVVVAGPLTALFGLNGAAGGWAVAALVQVTLNAYFLHRISRDDDRYQQQQQQQHHPEPGADTGAAVPGAPDAGPAGPQFLPTAGR